MARHRAGFVVVTLVLSTAAAQADRLSLAQAVDDARAHHPLLQRLAATRAQLEAVVGQTRSAARPSISLSGAARSEYVDPLDATRAEPVGFGQETTYNLALAANQLITDWGRTDALGDSARALEQQAAKSLAAAELDIELGAVQSYLAALEARDLAAASDDALALVNAQLARAQALFKTSLRPEIDVLSAKTQSAQARLQVIADRHGIDLALVALANAIGDAAPRSLELAPVAIEAVPEEERPPADLVALALSHRAELAGLREAVAAAEAKVRVGRKRTAPILSLQAGVFGSGAASDHQPPDAVSLRLAAGAFAQLSLQWDLYNGSEDSYEVASARAEARAARAEVARVSQKIMASVREAAIGVQQAREVFEAVARWRGDAERQLKVAQTRYDNSVGNFVELNDARVGLATAQRQDVQARYALAQSRAKLARELGRRPGGLAR